MPPAIVVPFAVGLVVLAVLSAVISALETGFFALSRSRMEVLRAQQSELGKGLSRIMENPRRLLSAVLIADALANAPLMIGSLALIEGQRGFDIPFWVSALLIFALIVFACDLVPKLVGLGAPLLVVRFGTRLLGRLLPLVNPLSELLERGSERVALAILPEKLRTQQHLSDEELGTLVEMSAAQGGLQETETEMISEIIKLGDKTAKDCMTPRVEMFSLPDDLTNEEVITLVRQRRLRRVAVHGETPDDIEGVLDVPSLLRDPGVHYTEHLGVPSFVPETMKAFALLKSFLSHAQGIAFVVDEHGGVEGIVTLRDLVEEIIGDAVPPTDAKFYIEEIGDGRVLASGSARLEDITEALDVPFEEEGIDTIGGLIFTQLGQLPKKGQVLKIGRLRVTVRRVSRKRVDEVLLVREAEPEEEVGA
ncbi:MAG: hemolysin family protein [Chthoniobacteraceae bacterium]